MRINLNPSQSQPNQAVQLAEAMKTLANAQTAARAALACLQEARIALGKLQVIPTSFAQADSSAMRQVELLEHARERAESAWPATYAAWEAVRRLVAEHEGRSDVLLEVKDVDLHEVEATVWGIAAEFSQVQLESADGFQLSINRHTTGVDWRDLHEGDRLLCQVTLKRSRVVSASVLS